MIIATTDKHGNPRCPMWVEDEFHVAVKREGEFCSLQCWLHFHTVIHEMGEVVEMDYLDIEEQPWYGVEHG